MTGRLIVLARDNWREWEIGNVKNTHRNRRKVQSIVDSLNRKYIGFNYFTFLEVSS